MAFQNPTNEGRVRKIIETLQHINTSAASNRVPDGEIITLLEPVVTYMRDMGAIPHAAPTPARSYPGSTWGTIRQMSEEASLADLTVAMVIYLNRIDEFLKTNQGD